MSEPGDYDEGFDDDRRTEHCTVCGGEGYTECFNPLECTRAHLGGDYTSAGGDVCPCAACGGSGKAEDQTIW